MSILIEPLGADNIADLATLYKQVYGRARRADYFELKYAPNYPERPPLGFLAYAGEEKENRLPVGFYGALPCQVFSAGETRWAAQCADAMTHPQYRRQGLFIRLARLTIEACKNSGVRLLFGFPNQYSLPGFIKELGWESGERMDCFRFPVGGTVLSKMLRRLGVNVKVYDRYEDFILKGYGPERVSLPDRTVAAGLLRDEAWINQKQRAGMRQLTLEKTRCWIRPAEDLLIGDLAGETGALKSDLARLKHLARRLGLSALQFHSSPGTGLHNALLKETAPLPSFTIIYKDLGAGIAHKDLKFTLADIDTF